MLGSAERFPSFSGFWKGEFFAVTSVTAKDLSRLASKKSQSQTIAAFSNRNVQNRKLFSGYHRKITKKSSKKIAEESQRLPKGPSCTKNSTESNFSATVRKKNATAITKRHRECSEALAFLGKRGRKTVWIVKTTAVAKYDGIECRTIFGTEGSFGFSGRGIWAISRIVRSVSVRWKWAGTPSAPQPMSSACQCFPIISPEIPSREKVLMRPSIVAVTEEGGRGSPERTIGERTILGVSENKNRRVAAFSKSQKKSQPQLEAIAATAAHTSRVGWSAA